MSDAKGATDVARFLPMNPVEFLVLTILVDGEQYGYGIVQAMGERTGGKVKPRPGNLYRVLDRLMKRGLLTEAGRRAVPDAKNERRRYYEITDLGRRVATAEAALLREVLAKSGALGEATEAV